jgi:hypothetical protein
MPDFGEFDQGWHPQKMRACTMMSRTSLRMQTKLMQLTQMETKHICFFNPSNDTPTAYASSTPAITHPTYPKCPCYFRRCIKYNSKIQLKYNFEDA